MFVVEHLGRGWGVGGRIDELCAHHLISVSKGESWHCALLLDYVPPEEPPGKPLGNALRIR